MSSRTHSCGSIATPDDLSALLAWAGDYPDLTLDLGAGDARYARDLAHAMPDRAVLAVDTCGTNATRQLRKAPGNLRFLVADARSLPHQLSSLDCTVVINFPWGSLLAALLRPEPDFVASLAGRPLLVRVNAGALAEAGFAFDDGVRRLVQVLDRAGANPRVRALCPDDLRNIPSTWSKRLAFGRDPRAIELRSVPPARLIEPNTSR